MKPCEMLVENFGGDARGRREKDLSRHAADDGLDVQFSRDTLHGLVPQAHGDAHAARGG